jgi:methionyl-tRNA formyltransferase
VIEDKSKQYDLIAPGTIADIIKGDVFVKTLDGIIQLKLIQPAGKNVMDMRAFMNGSGKTLFYIGKQLNN